ncbi:hypothetical protein ACFLYA_02140 [Candidatus Dependentiae bacterium]
MKNIKYFLFLSAMLAITSNTSYTMKKTALKGLGKPVFTKTFSNKIERLKINPDYKILVVILKKPHRFYGSHKYVIIPINWKNKKIMTVPIEENYPLSNVDFTRYNHLSLSFNHPGHFQRRNIDVKLKGLYPDITDPETYKIYWEQKQLKKIVNANSGKFCKDLTLIQTGNQENPTYSVILKKGVYCFNDPEKKPFKVFPNAKSGLLSIQGKYVRMVNTKDEALQIFDIINNKMIINLKKDQYEGCSFVGPDHILIEKNNTIKIFKLDNIKSNIHRYKKKLHNNVNNHFVNIIIKTNDEL